MDDVEEALAFFDAWALEIMAQMHGKGHSFSPQDETHTAAMLVLVASEIHEAIDVVKKYYAQPKMVAAVGEEFADALIRMGHFASTIGITIGYYLPFSSFNACGATRVSQFGSFRNGQWAVIARLGRLASMAHAMADDWPNRTNSGSERAFNNLFASLCGAAVALNVDLDQAVMTKTIINGQREYRYGLSTHGS